MRVNFIVYKKRTGEITRMGVRQEQCLTTLEIESYEEILLVSHIDFNPREYRVVNDKVLKI